MPGGGHIFAPPKSAAGKRTVTIPSIVIPQLRIHLDTNVRAGAGALVFTSPEGAPLRRGNFRRRVWVPALESAGLPAIHFHDLRHTGNSLTANAGANLRELMDRMGHASPRAALIYLHSTSERQQALADAVSKSAGAALKRAKADGKAKVSGTEVARAVGE
jgi:integrase